MPVATLSRQTHPEPLDAGLVRDIAAGIAAVRPLWGPLVVHDPLGRHPVRLLATERYEIWVIGWSTGQGVPLHDHGADTVGALAVVDGSLSEDRLIDGGLHCRHLTPGTVHDLPARTIHEVTNRRPQPATSIHVYSPPLTAMTHYDRTLRPTVTEMVPHQPPTYGVPVESLLDHPSSRV